MIFRNIIFCQDSIAITNALKGQNHQHRATPCDWITQPFQALKGQNQASLFRPFRASNLRVYPFHRVLPDANAKRLSAFTTVTDSLFFNFKFQTINFNKPC